MSGVTMTSSWYTKSTDSTLDLYEHEWLYFQHVEKLKQLNSVTPTWTTENWHQMVRVTGSHQDVDVLKSQRERLKDIESVLYKLPKEMDSQSFKKALESQAQVGDLLRDKVFTRFTNDRRYCEIIGRKSNVDALLNSIGTLISSSGAVREIAIFETPQCHLQVSVCHQTILNSGCEAIVCPFSRSHLQSMTTQTIMRTAGSDVHTERQRKIQSLSSRISQVEHTSAGGLAKPVKYILHVSSPQTRSELHHLKETFLKCLMRANELKVSSIALPTIGSGRTAITPEEVANKAFTALIEFDEKMKKSKNIYLKTVKFFDISRETSEILGGIMKSQFSKPGPVAQLLELSGSGASSGGGASLFESTHGIHLSNVSQRSTVKSDDQQTKQSDQNLATGQRDEICVICRESLTEKTLDCGHQFHAVCIQQQIEYQSKCPCCGKVFGTLKGEVLDGQKMTVKYISKEHLDGYPGSGIIEITYIVPSGRKNGCPYKGTTRTAYLPDNEEGKEVYELLYRAFEAGLIFTVGSSTTTGEENVVTWNDVHHKTNKRGTYGYPDQGYLQRVRDELAAKGIS